MNPEACRAPYAPDLDACLTTPPLDVDPARPPRSLEVTYDVDTEAGRDEAIVLLDRDDDGDFETELARLSGPSPGAPVTARWSLDDAGWGSTARVRFRFTSDAAGAGLGWSIYGARLRDGLVDADSVAATGVSKSILTVGASETWRPGSRHDELSEGDCGVPALSDPLGEEPLLSDESTDHTSGLASFSSRGPCDDGRIKPDLVAPGTFVAAPRSRAVLPAYRFPRACGLDPATAAAYSWFGGTSCATPFVAGAAALVRQYFEDGWHPNHSAVTRSRPDPTDAFEPSAALVKATLLVGAFPLSPGQFAPPAVEIPPGVPNPASGHGRLDVMGSLFAHEAWGATRGARLLVHDDRVGLSTGETRESTFEVAASQDPLRTTLTWTDPPATPGAGTALVNDLDLVLRAPDGTRHLPGPAGGPNRIDNVETILLPAGTFPTGTWTLIVEAFDVPGTASAPGSTVQPFAVALTADVDTGCAQETDPPAFAGLESAAPPPGTCGTIELSWSPAADACPGPLTYRVYRDVVSPVAVGAATLVAEVSTTSFRSQDLPAITTFHHVVRAVDASGNEDGNLRELPATTAATDGTLPCPDCPRPEPVGWTLRAAPVRGTGAVRLTWEPPATGPLPVAYRAIRLDPARGFGLLAVLARVTVPQHDVAGALLDGAFHAWRVTAINACEGESVLDAP